MGALLLSLGLSWLRKAWLRASGHKAPHDEDGSTPRPSPSSRSTGRSRPRRDAVGFAVAFKGVFLEGTEVILIVISLGASQGRLGLAAAAAAAAAILVIVVGAIVARQLSKVPENTIKLTVGVMLTSFGLFWIGEGAGIRWPGADAFLLVLVALFAVLSAAVIPWLRRTAPPVAVPAR